MTTLFRCQIVLLLASLNAMIFAVSASSASAQLPRNAPGFWGLRPGNQITVLVASSRRTEISIDGKPDIVQETSESHRIQYRVAAIDRSGDILVQAVVQKLARNPSSPILVRLADLKFSLTIQPSGQVSTISPEDRDALVTYLSNGDPESAVILKKCVTDETIESWLHVPFWLIPPVDSEGGKSWERSHEMSLGTLGTVLIDLDFQLGEVKDDFAKVEIVGKSRFRPLVLPDSSERHVFPSWSNTTVEVDGVTGTGQMAVISDVGEEPVKRRPTFESVEWTVRLHGETHSPTAPATKSTASPEDDADGSGISEKERPDESGVRFRMTQNNAWTLQSYSIGTPRMFDNRGAPIPLQ
ncbi:MAG TPA: hypothetical protein PLY87_26185 [Planctomycetaceae bacterium]|nr:hypothetical protein [Planctomycetaceae bacterium]HQZ68614.1 hypothetical protein [Planctomycetaceae bacterium]